MLMKMRNRRLSFTLLEITVALTILVLLASLTSVYLKRLIDTHRFETSVGELFTSLQEALVLSATYQADLCLDIEEKGGEFFYHFSTDEPIEGSLFSVRKKTLSCVQECRFQEKKLSCVHLDIYAGGRIEPSGILSFLPSQEEGRALHLDLTHSCFPKLCYAKPAPPSLPTQLQKPKRTP